MSRWSILLFLSALGACAEQPACDATRTLYVVSHGWHSGIVVEREAHRRHFDEAPRVVEPALRVRREIGVVREDPLGRNDRRHLHQEALGAQAHTQRVVDLGALEVLGREVGVGERLGAEVDDHEGERRAARAAAMQRSRDVFA